MCRSVPTESTVKAISQRVSVVWLCVGQGCPTLCQCCVTVCRSGLSDTVSVLCGCVLICPHGKYGQGYQSTCQCCVTVCRSGLSDTVSVLCGCVQICPHGKYGQGCQSTCQCQNGAGCDHVDGECFCTPGWSGEHCELTCPPYQ